VFLLMVEATIATMNTLLSTVALGVSLLLGVGTTMIILGLLSPSGLSSPPDDDGNNELD
jgi:hypothetical protein